MLITAFGCMKKNLAFLEEQLHQWVTLSGIHRSLEILVFKYNKLPKKKSCA
jgi:hypothetical protein